MALKMPVAFSAYLDFLRLSAAATVLLSHYPVTAAQAAITDRFNFGYDAVILFFVLSGYVISYAVNTKEQSGLTYTVNRMARILPVSTVAIMLSWLLMTLGSATSPALYPESGQLESPWYYIARTLSFSNEFWWDDIRPFGNGPYWSLAFEVWCYIIYGLAVFTRGRWRVALVLGALLLTGPKQWLLLPVWLLEVATYHHRDRLKPPACLLWVLCLLPVVAYLAVQLNNPRDWSYPLVGMKIEQALGHGLDGAANFGWGYLLALLVSLHLFAARQLCLSSHADGRGRLANMIRKLASYTFSIYILHFPLLIFWQAQAGHERDFYDPLQRAAVYAATLAPIYILGKIVEQRKDHFKVFLHAVVAQANRLRRAASP